MGTQYKNILKILEKWPIDPTKKGRDIGEHIRTCVKTAFNTGVGFRGDLELCDLKCASLKRLSDGYHVNSYKRTNTSSATGLSFDECKELLKNETLEYFQRENRSMLTKLKDKVKGN